MDVLEAYDAQVSTYLKETNPIVLPLLSWDAHMINLNKLTESHKDVIEINKIMNQLSVDVDIVNEFKNKQKVILITDASLKIEFVSSNMLNMSGYLPSEILGNTPKMFQGKTTDKKAAKQIRKYINAQKPFEAILVNYKKDKSTYDCHIKGYPIFNKKGDLVKYLAIEDAA